MSTLQPRASGDPAQLAAEIHDELQSHLEESAAALIGEGWPEEAAWAEAHRRFGDLRTITQSCTRERLPRKTMLQKINLLLILALVAGVATLTVRSSQDAEAHDREIAKLHAAIGALQVAQPAVAAANPAASNPAGTETAAWTASPATQTELAKFEEQSGLKLSVELREAALYWLERKPHAGPKLVAFGDDAIPLLVALLDGELKGQLHQIRFVAANHLGEINSPAAYQPLIDALDDPWFNVRRCAALALGKLGDPKAMAPLEELAASDPYVYRGSDEKGPLALVRIDAEKALEMLR